MAAYAAAAGPVLLMLGKITKGVGTLSTGIGKFATAVGKAGGGWKGFFSTLSKSPAMWLAVAAAVVTATAALVDYVSGAKQAREALESMNETAQQWKDTAAETFYGTSEGLSFFGMSEATSPGRRRARRTGWTGCSKCGRTARRKRMRLCPRGRIPSRPSPPAQGKNSPTSRPRRMKAAIPAFRSNLPRTSKRWILWIRRSNLCSRSGRTAISRNLTRSGCRNSSIPAKPLRSSTTSRPPTRTALRGSRRRSKRKSLARRRVDNRMQTCPSMKTRQGRRRGHGRRQRRIGRAV